LRIGSRYLGLRFNAAWDKFPAASYINMNYGFSFSFGRVQTSYMGKYRLAIYPNRSLMNITSQILISAVSFPWVQPQLRTVYDHNEHRFSRYGIVLNKRLFRTGQLSFSFERNQENSNELYMLTFNFFAPFASFTSRLLSSDKSTSMSQVQRGSILFDSESGIFRFDRRSSVGFGSAVIRPFRDDNFNGIRDGNEDYIPGTRARIMGGREHPSRKNAVYYYDGLRPYEDYLIQIDQNSIDNPSLKPAHENYKVSFNPNVVTSVQVPLVPVSEMSGAIQRQTAEGRVGVGGVKIIIVNQGTEAVTELPAFSNGEFFYEGLIPGSYKIYIDPEQLAKYGYKSAPESIEFDVAPADAGKCKENVNFTLLPEK
jgi:hypothetical protein